MTRAQARVRILSSARKHEVQDQTMLRIMAAPIYRFALRSRPPKVALLGIADNLSPLEAIYVVDDDGTRIIIHAMTASTAFLNRVRRDRKDSR